VKPTPQAVSKPSSHSIMHGLDKPGVFTTVSFFSHRVGAIAVQDAEIELVVVREMLHTGDKRLFQ
jgi:hypothetical protein